MSTDARNSLVAWGAVLGLFGFLWLDSHYHLARALGPMPPWFNWAYYGIIAVAGAVGIVRKVRDRLRARASR